MGESTGAGGPLDDLHAELAEWWDEVWAQDEGRRSWAVVVPAPDGWGVEEVADRLVAQVAVEWEDRVARAAIVDPLDGLDGVGLQTEWLRDQLNPVRSGQVLEALGSERSEGAAGALLDVASIAQLLSVPIGIAAGIVNRLLPLVVYGRDRARAGQLDAVSRVAAGVARFCASLPVLIVVKHAERLEPALVERFVTGVTGAVHAQALVVVCAAPGAPVVERLTRNDRYGALAERVHLVEVATMDEPGRRQFTRATRPEWPDDLVARLAERAGTFDEIRHVLAAPAVQDLDGIASVPARRKRLDEIIHSVAVDTAPSSTAVSVLTWAGGVMHRAQYDAAAELLAFDSADGDVVVQGTLVRPARRVALRQIRPVMASYASRTVDELMDRWVSLAAPVEGSSWGDLDRIAALSPLRRVVEQRGLDDRTAALVLELARHLEVIGDLAEAAGAVGLLSDVVTDLDGALAADVSAVTQRLAAHRSEGADGGAVIGIEARVWQASRWLDGSVDRAAGVELAEEVRRGLDAIPGLPEAVVGWRCQLAYHVGRAGRPDLAAELVAPLFSADDDEARHLGTLTLELTNDPMAEVRIERLDLERRWAARGPDATDTDDEALALSESLALASDKLGDWRAALSWGEIELAARLALQGPDHRGTLITRHNIAAWTGRCGRSADALALFEALLPDRVRVLGADHPGTLATRNEVGAWTGACGRSVDALALFEALLPDRVRVLGADHPDTLVTRHNLAAWTGECGRSVDALALFEALLPDRVRVLGADHPGTLITRNDIAAWTGACGRSADALALFEALLPDQVRVLGADHPDTLTTRNNIAVRTGACGRSADALALFEALLPDRVRLLGADHPDTLNTRNNIAAWTGECGRSADALALFEALLPDRVRVLGADHPDTLITRHNLAAWTGRCGRSVDALALFEALLPDRVRVLGADHPGTLDTRNDIAAWTGACGRSADALALFEALLPDKVRVLGTDHPATLATRRQIDRLRKELGRPDIRG